jgi:hypothetical protein
VNSSKRTFRRNVLSVLVKATVASAFATSPATAATIWTVDVTDDAAVGSHGFGSLRYAVGNAESGDSIEFDCTALACPVTITLSTQGNDQGFPGPTALSIRGKSITIAATNPGDVTLQAAPGSTSAASLRLFFVDSDAALTLQNLTLRGGKAIGGNGGGSGGGGAGLGGAIFSRGALTLSGVSFAANGAFAGSSGVAGTTYGGGGGLGGNGGNVYGGGGGTGGNGGNGSSPESDGGVGGQGLGGIGGGSAGLYYFSDGGAGSGGGGGGGGGAYRNGGGGSSGGGGGACGKNSLTSGAGGWGGGGGGGYRGGGGGFGGGGGGGESNYGNLNFGGIGGGRGGIGSVAGNAGGGGAGFGGAVFAPSGTLTLQNSDPTGQISGNTVAAGSGAHGGAAAGSGLFLMSGVTTTFDIPGTYTVADTIADDSPISVPLGQGYTPGSSAGAGITKQGLGTLLLDGANTYAGMTSIDEGTLGGTGTVVGPVNLGIGAQISPGDPSINGGAGVLLVGPLTWTSGSAMAFQLSASDYDQLLIIDGSLSKGGVGSSFIFHFGMGDRPPATATPYTLIYSYGIASFALTDFSFDFDPGMYTALTGHFSFAGIEGTPLGVLFTVDSITANRMFADTFD